MEYLLNVLIIILEVVKLYFITYFLTGLKSRRNKILKRVLLCGILGIAFFVSVYMEAVWARLLLYLASVMVLFEEKWHRLLLIGVWAVWSVSFMDSMISSTFSFSFGFSVPYAEQLSKIIVSAATALIIFLYGIFYMRFNRKRRTLPLGYYIFFAGIAFVNGILMTTYIDGITGFFETELPESAVPLLFLCLIGFLAEMYAVFMIGSAYLAYKESDRIKDEMLVAQQEHFKELEAREENTRKFRHDIKDHLYVIRDLMEKGNINAGREYVQRTVQKIDSLHIVTLKNKAVDSIVNHYFLVASAKEIFIEISGRLPDAVFIDMYDLCTIYSNILRNAIEGADRERDDRKIFLDTTYDDKFLYITERNVCSKEIVFRDGVPISSKKNRKEHGYGLKNIIETVHKYDGEVSFGKSSGEYSISILLKNGDKA